MNIAIDGGSYCVFGHTIFRPGAHEGIKIRESLSNHALCEEVARAAPSVPGGKLQPVSPIREVSYECGGVSCDEERKGYYAICTPKLSNGVKGAEILYGDLIGASRSAFYDLIIRWRGLKILTPPRCLAWVVTTDFSGPWMFLSSAERRFSVPA
jgi:hypothetical protein